MSQLVSALSSRLKQSGGSRIVGHKLSAVGSASRLAGEKLDELTFLTDFAGADPTGASYSDVAWNAATATVGTTTGGRTIVIPHGTFVITSASLAAKKGLRLLGIAGSVYSVVKVEGSLTCNNTGNFSCVGVTFVGAGFDIATRTVSSAPGAGNILFDMVDNCAEWDVRDCHFYGFDRVFRPRAGATNGSYIVHIEDNYFGWNNTTIVADGILHWTIKGNTFSEDYVANVQINSGGAFHVDENNHENSAHGLSSGYNIIIGDGAGAMVANSSVDGNQFHQLYGIKANRVVGLSIKGTQARLCMGSKAIELVNQCAQIGVSGSIITGYNGTAYPAYGVYIDNNTDLVTVRDNQFIDFQTTAYVSSPLGSVVISENGLRAVNDAAYVTGTTAEDQVVFCDNRIKGGTIRSVGNGAAWIAGPNYSAAATVLTNTDGKANASGKYGAKVSRSAGTQSINNNVATHLAFDAEDFAHGFTSSYGNAPASPDKVTCVQPGRYRIVARVKFDAVGAGKFGWAKVMKNNATELMRIDRDADSQGNVYLSLDDVFSLDKTDYVNVVVFQNDGAARNVSVASLSVVMV